LGILKRFPGRREIAALYGVIVLIIYSWTLVWFFWKFPSWINYLSIWEIVKAFCISVSTNLFESLAVVALPVLLAAILPQAWFRKEFVARAVVLVAGGLGYMMYLATFFQGKEDYPSDAIQLVPWVALVLMLAVFLVGKSGFVCKAINAFAERATIFLYLYIPLSLICLLVVLAVLVF